MYQNLVKMPSFGLLSDWPLPDRREMLRGMDPWKEDESHYSLSFAVPGVPRDNIQLSFLDRKLIMEIENHGMRKIELFLPKDAEEDATANLSLGILSIKIPKQAKKQAKTISITEE